VSSLIATRTAKGKFTDFSDYLNKIDVAACNKKVTESLIKAGAFDSLGHPRKGLFLVHTDAVDSVLGTKKAQAMGQFDLFGDGSDDSAGSVFTIKVPDEEWDDKHRLALEREMLGLYVSGHPLNGVAHLLAAQVGGQGPAAEHAPLLLVEGHQPHRPPGRLADPALGQLQQGGHAGGVVVGAGGVERAVVVGRHQQGIQPVLPAWKAQDQVGAVVDAAAEAVLLHGAQGAQALADVGAHRQQPEGIPAGMTGPGQNLQVGQEALLPCRRRRGRCGLPAVRSGRVSHRC
jgi:hypothetical protein